MNVIEEIKRINEVELANGIVNTNASWHVKYANSAWCYVGNLPNQLTEGDVICVMSQFGEVEDVNLVRDETTGKSRGFAFLKYEDARSCVLAVDNLNGTKILERSIRVDHVEKYRLPKNILEKEDGQGQVGKGKDSSSENFDRAAPGHAYRGKELESSYDINRGQDLFAPPSEAPAPAPVRSNTSDRERREEEERKAAKLERKEARAKKRREKEERRAAKEEKKRQRRASKMKDSENVGSAKDRDGARTRGRGHGGGRRRSRSRSRSTSERRRKSRRGGHGRSRSSSRSRSRSKGSRWGKQGKDY